VTSDLHLTAADQQNVQAAIRSLLVCAPYKSLTEWRLATHRAVRRLVDGDMAMSYLGMHQFEAVISEEIGRIGEFPTRAPPIAGRFGVFERSEALGVWNRSMLWGNHIGDFLRSSYYNDFARPLHAIDGVGLSACVQGLHAGLQVHWDSKPDGRFGNRALGLLRLMYPAFQVGIDIAANHFGVAKPPLKWEPPVNCRDGPSAPENAAPQRVAHYRSQLTRRELEVVRLLAARRSNYEIAELLHMSRATAKRHTENILQKLGLHSRREVERVVGDV
jgi:DNA-binding CsgD family transcriptional regulator